MGFHLSGWKILASLRYAVVFSLMVVCWLIPRMAWSGLVWVWELVSVGVGGVFGGDCGGGPLLVLC